MDKWEKFGIVVHYSMFFFPRSPASSCSTLCAKPYFGKNVDHDQKEKYSFLYVHNNVLYVVVKIFLLSEV